MKTILRESINKFLGVKIGDGIFDIRIWAEKDNRFETEAERNILAVEVATICHDKQSLHDVAEEIIQLEGVNAVEVADHFTGAGVVVYSNWP